MATDEKIIKKIKLDNTTYIIKDEAAYVKPSTGIPQTDLDESTQTTLTTINDLLTSDTTTVDTIREVLDVFAAYPEETTIVNALAGKAAVDHSHVLTPTNTTVVTAINPGSGSFTPTTKYLHETTASAAPNSHTHNVTVSGTTSKNSGTGVSVVTGVASNGTATCLTGVKVTAQPTISLAENTSSATERAQYVKSISGGSGSLSVYSSDTATTADTLATSGRIPYVASISSTKASASGTAKAGSETHTHTYDKASLSGSNSSHTVKYMKFSAGTTPKSGATPNHTSTNSGANSGTAVKAVTGYGSFSGGSLTGTKTFNTDAIKSIGGTRNYGFSASTSNVMTAPTVTNGVLSFTLVNAATQDAHTGTAASTGTVGFTAASLGTASTANVAPSGHTHTYDKTTSITLTAGTAPSMNFNTGTTTDTPYVASATNSSLALSHTSTASGGPSATTTFVTGVSGGTTTATTKYLLHSHTGASATTRYMSATASGTAVGADGTATVLTGVKASGTATVAPNEHTHTYGNSTALTTGGNSGSAVTVITDLTANTTAATGDIAYLESATHTHTGASVKSTDTVLKAVTID